MYIAVVLAIGVGAIALIVWMRNHVEKSGTALSDCVDNPPDRAEFTIKVTGSWPEPSALEEEVAEGALKNRIVEIDHSDTGRYVLLRLLGRGFAKGVGAGDAHPDINVVVTFDEIATVRAGWVVGWFNDDLLKEIVRDQVCPAFQVALADLRRREAPETPDENQGG